MSDHLPIKIDIPQGALDRVDLFTPSWSLKRADMVPEVSEAFKKSVDCCRTIKNNYTQQALDRSQFGKTLKTNCPEMPPRLVAELLEKIR
ncbi:MAG: hypothetical protein AAGD05_19060, partial [Bacteroidota bacterium]